MESLLNLFASTGFSQIQFGQIAMIFVGLMLLFLAIKHGFEPLLLILLDLERFWLTFPVQDLIQLLFLMRWEL